MSVREADAAGLREHGRALRTAAARIGLQAWSAEGLQAEAAGRWWGGHALLWSARARDLAQRLRETEERLRRVAGAAERWAGVVADAQARLAALDEEEAQVRADVVQALAGWEAEPAGTRGARPGAGPASAAVQARRVLVEEQAALEAQRFARAVDGAQEGLGRALSPVDAFRWVTGSTAYRAVTTSTAARDLAATTRRGAAAVAAGARRAPGVLRAGDRALGPVGVVADLDTLVNHVPGRQATVRERADYAVAAAGTATKGAVLVGAAVGVTAVAGVPLVAVATGAAVAGAVYGVGTAVLDVVARRRAPQTRVAAAQRAGRAAAPSVPRGRPTAREPRPVAA